jgi:hypothetical protein
LKIKAEAAQGRQWKKYICMLSFNYCHHHVVVECNSQKGKGHWHFLQQTKKKHWHLDNQFMQMNNNLFV